MAKKQKNQTIMKHEDALRLQCKALYFEFATIETIHRQTGVDRRQIQNWVYGSGSIYDVSEDSWLHERNQVTREEQEELMLRNKHLSVVLQSQAVNEIIGSLSELKNRKTKRGKKIPLTAFDMKQVSDTVLNIQKMNIVAGMNKNEESAPVVKTINSSNQQDDVIDMEAVAFAIKKDKAIMKLIERSTHERSSTTESKSETIETEAAGESSDDRARAGQREGRERDAESADQSNDTARADASRISGAHEETDVVHDRRAETNNVQRSKAARAEDHRDRRESTDQQNRDADSAASGDDEFSADISGAFEDGFADEYS